MRPRTRCVACAARHVQCDGVRPQCSPCLVTGRSCVWFASTKKTPVFYSENEYAQGTIRRPRGKRRHEKSVRLDPPAATSIAPSQTEDDDDSSESEPFSTIRQPSLRPFAAQLALNKYSAHVANNRRPRLVLDCVDIETFLAFYDKSLTNSKLRPLLESAWTAVALAHFGRSEVWESATSLSSEYYRFALRRVAAIVRDTDKNDIPDELLLTVMIMASYEDHVAGFHNASGMPNSFHHSHGAAALVAQRLRRPERTRQSMLLDTIVRSRNTKACINQGIRVPVRLHDQGKFLESFDSRCMSNYLIQLADLQVRYAELWRPIGTIPSFHVLCTTVQTAQRLDGAIEQLQQDLPPFISHDTFTRPSYLRDDALFTHFGTVTEYNSIQHAQLWNNARAARLRLNTLVIQALQAIKRHHPGQADSKATRAISKAEKILLESANDILGTIPYHFGCFWEEEQHSPTSSNTKCLSHELPALDVGKLSFPLHIVATAPQVQPSEKQTAVKTLLRVARAHGNIILERVYASGGAMAVEVLDSADGGG